MNQQRSSSAVTVAVLSTTAAGCSPGSGLSVSPEVYINNLKHLRDHILPKGWQLNAVQKWDAYGHRIKTLAGAAAKLGITISVLTNEEAREVLAGSQATGISRPSVMRIVPSDGPADYADVLDAARAGLGVQVRVVTACGSWEVRPKHHAGPMSGCIVHDLINSTCGTI